MRRPPEIRGMAHDAGISFNRIAEACALKSERARPTPELPARLSRTFLYHSQQARALIEQVTRTSRPQPGISSSRSRTQPAWRERGAMLKTCGSSSGSTRRAYLPE